MNSENERLSVLEMKERQKQMLDKAAAAQPAVTVLESNWRAMIDSQRMQVNSLARILESLGQLTTAEQLQTYLDIQLELLREDEKEMREFLKEYRDQMKTEMSNGSLLMERALNQLEKQVGNTSAAFGQAISEEQKNIQSVSRKLIWISLLPSLTLLILELVPRILSLIFHGCRMTGTLRIVQPGTSRLSGKRIMNRACEGRRADQRILQKAAGMKCLLPDISLK